MTPDRYAKDYKLTETADEKGHPGFAYTYAGDTFRLVSEAGLGRRILLGTAAAWIVFITALLLRSQAMRVFYISLPFAFTAVPLWFLAKTALFLIHSGRREEPVVLKQKEADLVNNTYPAAAMFSFVLPAMSLIGEAFAGIGGRWILPGDGVFTVCALILCAVGYVLFRSRPAAEAEKK